MEAEIIRYLQQGTSFLATGVEACAAILIGLAAIQATIRALLLFFRGSHAQLKPQEPQTENIRLRLGRWLALALEFELAADILRTAVAPTWSDIAQLAAIAAIRTALNYFLQQEIDRATKRQGEVPVQPALPLREQETQASKPAERIRNALR